MVESIAVAFSESTLSLPHFEHMSGYASINASLREEIVFFHPHARQ
jgi:hypothetical protein